MSLATLSNLPRFVKTTWSKYKALETKDQYTLYFITDTGKNQLFLGGVPYTANMIVLGANDALPAASSAVTGAIYYRQSDSTAHYFDGTNFLAMSVPKATSMSGTLESDNGKVPTEYAVQEFATSVAATAASTKLDQITGTNGDLLTVGTNGTSVVDSGKTIGGSTLTITDSAASADKLATEAAVKAYADSAASTAASTKLSQITGTTGDILTVGTDGTSVVDSGKTIGGATITIDQNNNTEASANRLATEKAVMTAIGSAKTELNDAITALGSVFNFKGTKADMSALNSVPATGTGAAAVGDVWHVTTGANGTAAEYVCVANNGSAVTWEELGTTIDMSGYATKVVASKISDDPETYETLTDRVATLTSTGNLQSSGKTIGGATLTISNDLASSDKLATEAAVKAYVDAGLAGVEAGAVGLVGGATAGHIPTLTADGGLSDNASTGIFAGGATFTFDQNSNTEASQYRLASEKGVVAYVTGVAGDKVDKFHGVENNILVASSTSASGENTSGVKDSGYTISTSAIPLSDTASTTKLPVESVIKSYVDTADSAKLDKLASDNANTNKVVLFDDGGAAVKSSGKAISAAAFSNNATPSQDYLPTEAAVAAYVLAAMSWQELQ